MIIADRLFDGFSLHKNAAVIFISKQIIEVGSPDELDRECKSKHVQSDATILPGFVKSHAHISYQNISAETVLKHDVTTVRDTGGTLHQPKGGNGELRLFSAEPIIQAHNGYPLNIFGQGHDGTGHGDMAHGDAGHQGKYAGIGIPVATVPEIGHYNVSWGINGEEMKLMLQLTSGSEAIGFQDVPNVFKSATSGAGKNLGMPLLGTLKQGAPVDIIAVKGNPFERFKLLEYPDLVISGGHIIVNNFSSD